MKREWGTQYLTVVQFSEKRVVLMSGILAALAEVATIHNCFISSIYKNMEKTFSDTFRIKEECVFSVKV